MKVNDAVKMRLLQEYVLDYDWSAAGKRVGLKPSQVSYIKRDENFMRLAEAGLRKAIVESTGVDVAVQRFQKTLKTLSDELESGNMSVASALIRAHEIEFRQHGLFEKDNGQKGTAVQINISLQQPENGVVIDGEKL